MTPTDYKTHRLRAGLTQKQLAARLGVSRVTINRREKGHDKISEEAALSLLSLPSSNVEDRRASQTNG